MNTKIKNYQEFFLDQVKEAEMEQKTIIKSPVNQLVKKEEIVVGYVDHVNDKTGHVVFKFPKDKSPRLKVQKSILVVKKTAKTDLGTKISDWACTFLDFCKNSEYHSATSDVIPLYYIKKNDPNYDYVGCTGISVQLYDLFKKTTASGKSLTIMMFSPFPPVEYYNNLVNFLEVYQDMPQLLIEPKMDFKDWHPEELSYNPNNETAIPEKIMETLSAESCCVLQGPPGTGKSYTIAHIIAEYLNANKTVCVTTMANKGLVELVQQPPLKQYLEKGLISKTNLSADERKHIKGLKPAKKGFVIPAGELLCSTNYVLSYAYNSENMSEGVLPQYDLVIIEEASQTFLASLLAFRQLGHQCLIVGDPMQLPPIVTNAQKSIYKAWNVGTQIEGLKTLVLGTDIKAFRIVTTFRLTPKSANLTAVFYNNRFSSVQKERIAFNGCPTEFFPIEGGTLYYQTNDFTNGVISGAGLNIIQNILYNIECYYPERSIAIITPFKESVKQLQKEFLTESTIKELTIETIDRIQGMTVDYAILYIPGRNPGFALDERRFNVATSRSRSTTLIISDIPLTDFHSMSGKVSKYLRECTCLSCNDLYQNVNRQRLKDVRDSNNIKMLYPGLEDIVDELLDHDIAFSHDGEVDLCDKNGIVIASAEMLLREQKIAINPIDESSEQIFVRAGYKTVSDKDFNINMVN